MSLRDTLVLPLLNPKIRLELSATVDEILGDDGENRCLLRSEDRTARRRGQRQVDRLVAFDQRVLEDRHRECPAGDARSEGHRARRRRVVRARLRRAI